MKQKICFSKWLLAFVLVTLTGLAATAAHYSYDTVPGDMMNARIYTLPNGLKVMMSVNKEKPRLQANIAVRTGSRNDPAETTGLAHYLEHLMFKGTHSFGTTDYAAEKPYLDEITRRYEAYRQLTDPAARKQAYHEIDSVSQLAARYNIPNEYDKLMAAIGSEGSNAYTSNDVTCYVENIPNNEIENWARVQSDRFKNMVIRGFHTELEAVYEEKNITMGSDDDKIWAALYKMLYPTHPYGTQTTIGEQEHLKNPSIVNITNYFNRYYVPNNVAIVLAGDFDPDKVIAIIDKYFGDWQPSATLSRPEFAPQPDLTAARDTVVLGNDAASVVMGWKLPAAASEQTDTLDLICDLLSNRKAGLLDVAERNMEVLSAMAGCDMLCDYSTFVMTGTPTDGQSLQQLRGVLLGELDKVRRGDFDDNLLSGVMANKRLDYYRSLQSNSWRASQLGDAFVTNTPWNLIAQRLERQSRITKADIVRFANKWLRDDNVATVYKEMGEDTTIKKIDKPIITPIPANREYQSQFVSDVLNSDVTPIEPQFVDFKRDLTVEQLTPNARLLYKHNGDDGLFNLVFDFKVGDEHERLLSTATEYLNYVGTKNLTASEFQSQLYQLACEISVSSGLEDLYVSVSGLGDNMQAAVKLAYDHITTAVADTASWNKFVSLLLKSRADAKTRQQQCFYNLYQYGLYGPRNPWTATELTEQELRSTDPQQLLDVLRKAIGVKHDVRYFGPSTQAELVAAVDANFPTPSALTEWPAPRVPFVKQATPSNEVLIAPFEAKNIYMRMIHNENRPFAVADLGKINLFNEYFGGGMNGVVFQELRETRGLAYNAWASYFTLPLKGQNEYFVTHIISQNDKMMDCIATFHSILDTMPQNEASFQLAKQNLIKSIQASRTTRYGVISAFVSAEREGLNCTPNEIVYGQLPGISLSDIVAFEKQNVAGKTYRYVILGDESQLDIPALEKIAPVKRLTLKDIFGY